MGDNDFCEKADGASGVMDTSIVRGRSVDSEVSDLDSVKFKFGDRDKIPVNANMLIDRVLMSDRAEARYPTVNPES